MPFEFDCVECGGHVIAFARTAKDDFGLCAHCLMFPGWPSDPRLVAIFAPGRDIERDREAIVARFAVLQPPLPMPERRIEP